MDWKELTVGQVITMLQDEKYFLEEKYPLEEAYDGDGENLPAETPVSLWKSLRISLEKKNKKAKKGTKPMFPIAYALAAVAAWHALSAGTDPENIDLEYLEDHYYLKNLFWDSTQSNKTPREHYSFPQYLAGGYWNGEYRIHAQQNLSGICTSYASKPFQPGMFFEILLNEICQEGTTRNPQAINVLTGILEGWLQEIPETDLPPWEQRPFRGPDAPDKGAPDLKWDLQHTFARDVCGLIENNIKQFIFTGAPGTGKTYAAKLLARYMGDIQKLSGKEESSYTIVQFHPSYDYTDFVEGLRPVQKGDQIQFVKVDGTFKAFCRRVVKQENPDGKYFFIIDEINRAELSKVFGELMYCLESDKRGSENKIQTQYQNLRTFDLEQGRELEKEDDVFSEGFYIPENVYVIGTMNDIDRSVESMDFALRRRFNMREAVVDREMLENAFSAMGFDENAEELAGRVTRLNAALENGGKAYGLNRQYFISHGQFANLPTSIQMTGPLEEILDFVWNYRLETLLREYLRGVDEQKVRDFVKSCKKAFWGVEDKTDESTGTKTKG